MAKRSKKNINDFKLPKLKTWLRPHLRRLSLQWPGKNEAFRQARIERGIYQCQLCKLGFKRNMVEADHKEPIIDPIVGFIDYNNWLTRMFCAPDGYRILCKECHRTVTQKQNLKRK